MFLGTYNHTLDAKKRLSLPSKIRNLITSNTVMITLSPDGCLELRTIEHYTKYSEQITSLGNLKSDFRKLQRYINGNTFSVDIDNSNRILLPSLLINNQLVNISKEVTLVGAGEKLEIWDSAQYNKILKSDEENIFEIMNNIKYDE